jgi:hypothetical protein
MKNWLFGLTLSAICFAGALPSNAATYDIHKGWNLLGAPCRIEVSNFQKDGIKTVWKWKDCGWQVYSPDENIQNLLKAYGIPSFDAVEPLEGFWVNAERNMKINVTGCSLGNETGTVDLNRGLVAYWSFDNCTAVDDSGNGNNGELEGSLQCVDGIRGKGFYFDGNSWITVGKTESLSTALESQNFSIFLCFNADKVDNVNGDDTDHDNGIIIFWDDDTQGGGDRWIKLDEGKVYFTGYEDPTVGGGEIEAKKWYCITYVSNKLQNKSYFYLNGKLIDTKDSPASPHSWRTFVSIGAGHYGYIWDGDGLPDGDRFQGIIDEVRIYNRALSDEEVKALYDMYSKKENKEKENLVYNGDFETGTDGWRVVEFTSGAKVSLLEENGNHFIRMHHDTTDDWCSLGQEIASKLEKGKTYVFSYRYRTKNNVELGIRFTEPSTIVHSTAISKDYGWNHKLVNDGKWHYDSFEFTVTDSNPKPDEPYLGIFFDYHFKGDVDIDDISITEKE